MKKLLSILLSVMLLICATFLCVGCDENEKVIYDRFSEIGLNQNVPIQDKYLKVTTHFDTDADASGYYKSAKFTVEVSGYSELTYFNAKVVVTFYATCITEIDHEGKDFEYSVEVLLDPNGKGEGKATVTLVACRGVTNKSKTVKVSGSVTKVRDSYI